MKVAICKFAALPFLGLALSSTLAGATALSTPVAIQSLARESSARIMVMAGSSGALYGFTIEWIKKSDFDAAGGWPAAGDPAIKSGDFTGVPVWVVYGTSGDFTLPPVMWQAVQLGELFDESGLTTNDPNELDANTEYIFRVKAKAGGGFSESAPSQDLSIVTSAQIQNCTFTQGYWKNHASAWPSGNIMLGTVSYTPAQAMQIFNQAAGGNGLLILAHQLLAAKLNIANGADASSIASTIAAADALIGGLVCPPIGSGSLSPASVNALATTLDNYNNGLVGPGHCSTTPAGSATWGSLKALYRH